MSSPAAPAIKKSPTLHLCSFGFHKSGIPPDTTGHGGGYVFDCRGLPNPGREPALADLTGQDAEVIAFLEADPRVQSFLAHVLPLVIQHAQNYGERGFTDLTVCFGCTGGRHRSVYCAEKTAEELRRHGYRVELLHIDKPD